MENMSHFTNTSARLLGLSSAFAMSFVLAAQAQDTAATTVDTTIDTVVDTATDAVAPAVNAVVDALTPNDTATAETDTAAQDATEAAPALSTGTPVENNVGRTYTLETHGEWDVRCIKAPEGQQDPCNISKILKDETGNDVAEFSLFYLGRGEVEAGGTVVTPLETLLTEQVTMSVDGQNGRRYPYAFCNQIGCVAQFGLTSADVTAFKKGGQATVRTVPAPSPKNPVLLDVSLSGFTAAYTRVKELTLEAREKAAAAQ
jgi:invasion protein IalB